MACTSNSMNFSQFTKTTKFKESQIRNFYLYFKKYSKETPDQLSYLEFKDSIGILGVKSNDFICLRLFNIISDRKNQRLSFGSYLSFMNLVNYGSIEEKITHSFKFFDMDGKGFISKEDFRRTILSLCEYFSTVSSSQMKIRQEDVDVIFDDMMEKSGALKLDLNSFISVSNNYPKILDFFDIFNNKILDNLTLIIHKDTLKKIENVVTQLKSLIVKTEKKNLKTNYDVTISLKSYMEQSVKNKKMLEKTFKIAEDNLARDSILSNNGINSERISNYLVSSNAGKNTKNKTSFKNNIDNQSPIKTATNSNCNGQMFLLSDKIKNRFSENKSFDENELEVSSELSDEYNEQEELVDLVFELDQIAKTPEEIKTKRSLTNPLYVKDQKNSEKNQLNNNISPDKNESVKKEELKENMSETSFNIIIENIEKEENDDFDFIQPVEIDDIIDKDLLHQILQNGIEIGECLIITNKKAFIKYISNLKDTLKNIVVEIDPSKRIIKRRQAFSLDFNKGSSPIDKEDYLNSPFLHVEEKGLIHFGNENVEMVLNMMIGIRNSVNSLGANKNLFPLSTNDDAFKEINRFQFTHNSTNKEISCRFYDYAPKVFYNLRKLYGIQNEDYIKSLGPENFLGNLILIKNRSLRELCSTGKSGSFFYYSYDSKFVLKTIPEHEFLYFEEILQDYYHHIVKNPNTMLQRFFGMHTMYYNDTKMHFVIMNNVFITNIQVHYKYDLKGSSYQRLSRKKKENNYDDYDYNIPMKDNDFSDRKEKMSLLKQEKDMIKKELQRDSMFLASKNINDYSLLIGVHNPDYYNGNSDTKFNLMEQLGQVTASQKSSFLRGSNKANGYELYNENDVRKPFYEKHRGGMLSLDGKQVYFFGIIDILTQYG